MVDNYLLTKKTGRAWLCVRKRSYAGSVAPELLTLVIFAQTVGMKIIGRRFCKCLSRSWRLNQLDTIWDDMEGNAYIEICRDCQLLALIHQQI